MRREIEGKRFPEIVMAITISFLLPAAVCFSQTLPDDIISIIEQIAEDGGESSVEEYMGYFDNLINHPLNINSASRGELERFPLFSLFQIESILEYKKEFGDILSLNELSLIDGFSSGFVKMISPFISIDSGRTIGLPDLGKRWSGDIILRGKKKWKTEGMSYAAKYKLDYADKISAGINLESDAGEKLTKYYLPDYTSMYVGYKGSKLLNNVIIGDYTARFGQGLVVWKAFPVSFMGGPSSSVKRESALRGHSSTSESDYLRGAGATFSLKNGKLSCFASLNGVDARLSEEGEYTSIVSDGYHVTEAQLQKRHAMKEYLAGINYCHDFNNWKLGVTAAWYSYNKKNGRKIQDYNKYQYYDGWWGNVGFDYYGVYGNFRFFGELATDPGFAFAALSGLIWSPFYKLEMSMVLRSYSKKYIATHAGAYSTLSSCSNQRGATFSAQYIFNGGWKSIVNIDYSYYPWSRFRVDGASSALKGKLSLTKEYLNGSSMLCQVNCNYKSEEGMIFKGRFHINTAIGRRWKLGTEATGNLRGFAVYQDVSYKSANGKFESSARVTYYNTKDWNSRVYLYERGMPQSYSVETYSGKGTGVYLVLRYSPVKSVDLWLKWSLNYSAFLIRIFIPG